MAPQSINILRRDEESSSKNLYIVGFVVAGLAIAGVAVWLTIRFLRQRARRNGEDNRGVAFLNVRGLVKDGEKANDDPLPKYGLQCSTLSAYRLCSDYMFIVQ